MIKADITRLVMKNLNAKASPAGGPSGLLIGMGRMADPGGVLVKCGKLVALAGGIGAAAGLLWYFHREGNVTHQQPGIPGRYSRFLKWYRVCAHFVRALVSPHQKVKVERADKYERDLRHHLRRELKLESFQAPCHKSEMHGHPNAAGLRRGVHMEIVKQLRTKGFKPYDISSSRRSNALKTDGYHGWFTERDFNYPELNLPVEEATVFVMIDVDYYMDMHSLASLCRPMILWTCDPAEPTGKTEEEQWVFEGEYLTYQVRGGGKYEHKMWDYGCADYCAFRMGAVRYTYAKEEVRVPGSQHKLVILTPVSTGLWTTVHEVSRRQRYDGIRRYFGEVVITDGTQEYRLTAACYDSIVRRLSLSKNTQLYSIAQYLDSMKDHVIKGDRGCLAVWIASNRPSLLEAHALTWASWVQRDGKDVPNQMVARTTEVVPPPTNVTALAPTNAPVAIAAAVVHRVQDVRNETKPPKEVFHHMEEFITMVLADMQVAEKSLEPLSVEEVQSRTHNSKTVRRMEGVATDPFFDVAADVPVQVEAFSKSETYVGKAKERVISPVDDVNLTMLARFTYALKPFLKRTRWYCPGMTPEQIANAMQELARSCEELRETDYSNFDGTINKWLRHLEKRLYVRSFSGEHSKQVGECIKREISVETARTKAGRYRPGGIRLSGSGLTTDGNTILNAFMQFLALRRSGQTAEEAYRGIGLCFGDDGVMGGNVDQAMKAACDECGLVIKMLPACTAERPYVTFLGRVYPEPRDSTYSFQEPMRVWPKIHLISRSNPGDEAARHAAKVGAFIVIDGKSPLLGNYARKLLSLHPAGPAVRRKIAGAKLISELSENWFYQESQATISNSWPQDDETAAAHYDLYCHLLGITREQADRAEEAIASAKTLAELANVLELPTPALPDHIAVDGDAFTNGRPLQMQSTNRPAERAPCGKETQKSDRFRGVGSMASTGSEARDKNKVKKYAPKTKSDQAPGPAAQTRWRRKEQPPG